MPRHFDTRSHYVSNDKPTIRGLYGIWHCFYTDQLLLSQFARTWPSWTRAQNPRKKWMTKSLQKPPWNKRKHFIYFCGVMIWIYFLHIESRFSRTSMPRCSRMRLLTCGLVNHEIGWIRDKHPNRQQLFPWVSATWPATTHGQKKVFAQRPRSSQQPHRPLFQFDIMVFVGAEYELNGFLDASK